MMTKHIAKPNTMKRPNAFLKFATICLRLDLVDPDSFFIIPQSLYLFGSLLTDKPTPNDIDLLLHYQYRPDQDIEELYDCLVNHIPLPTDRAAQQLRQGMKMVRFEFMKDEGLSGWLSVRHFPADTPVRLIWQPGLDWQPILDEIQANPLPWDKEASSRYKQLTTAKARRVALEKGFPAAEQWMKEEQNRDR